MKHLERHRILFHILRPIVAPVARLILRFRGPRIKSDEPALIIANHTSDWDPIILGMIGPGHTYFVSSEHVLRAGFASRLLAWAIDPIPRLKGRTESRTALEVVRRIRAGANVGIFAEGNKSWDGLPGALHPSSGKLVKSAKCRLITVCIRGGYLSTPRWGHTLRRGRMTAELRGSYSREEIGAMTNGEVMALIERDIRYDEYGSQRENPVRYRGSKRAEYIETALYVCPVCGAVDSLTSKGNGFSCRGCGTADSVDEYGFFSGSFGFNTAAQWNAWQETRLDSVIETLAETPLSDEDISVCELLAGHRERELSRGTLTMTREELLCGTFGLKLSDIQLISVIQKTRIVLSANEASYEIRAKHIYCARKYAALIRRINGIAYI